MPPNTKVPFESRQDGTVVELIAADTVACIVVADLIGPALIFT